MSLSSLNFISSNIQNNNNVYPTKNWVWTKIATSQLWYSVDITPDALKIVACINGSPYIYLSIDGGTSFNTIGPNINYRSVCISGDGQTIIAVPSSGAMKYSIDGGSTFNNGPSNAWHYLKKSPDSSKYIASTVNNYLYVSSNVTSWTALTNMGARIWTDVDISNNGLKIVACAENTGVYYSSDGGSTFTQIVTTDIFYPVSLSIDETALIAGSTSGNYVSVWRDGNFSVAARYNISSLSINSLSTGDYRSAISSSGGYFLVVGDFKDVTGNGGIFMSYDSGYTWAKNTSTGSPTDRKIIHLVCTPSADTIVAISWGIAGTGYKADNLYIGKYV